MATAWHEQEFPEPTSPPADPLPQVDQIRSVGHGAGLDPQAVSEAFDVFHRHVGWYRDQVSALPALMDTSRQEARSDALRLIRAAAEFADVLERDAQEVAAKQIAHVDGEMRRRESEIVVREAALARELDALERRREELLAAARRDAEEILAAAERAAVQIRQEAELAKLHVLEEARRQIAEVSNATRAEVEHTMEWSRAQAEGIVKRSRAVAEQVLTASLRGHEHVAELVAAIARASEAQAGPPPAALAASMRPALPFSGPEEVAPGPVSPERRPLAACRSADGGQRRPGIGRATRG